MLELMSAIPSRGGGDVSAARAEFRGELSHVTTCCNCNTQTNVKEAFSMLSVPVHETRAELLSTRMSHILRTEHMLGDNKIHCDTCSAYTEAERTTRLSHAPRMLVVHLNRSSLTLEGKV